MPYKSRSINWNLLLDPVSQARSQQIAAGARLGDNVSGGLADLATGVRHNRAEKESKRRYEQDRTDSLSKFDQEISLRRDIHAEDIQLRRDALQEKAQERAGNDFSLLAAAGRIGDKAAQESEAQGQPTPDTVKAAQAVVGSLGPNAADKFKAWNGSLGASPTGSVQDRYEALYKQGKDIGDPEFDATVTEMTKSGLPIPHPFGSAKKPATTGPVSLRQDPISLRPEAPKIAPVAPPAIAPDGTVMNPSVGMYEKADAAAQEAARLQRNIDQTRTLAASKTFSNEAKATAEKSIADAETRLARLTNESNTFRRQADAAKELESRAYSAAKQQEVAQGKFSQDLGALNALYEEDYQAAKDPKAKEEVGSRQSLATALVRTGTDPKVAYEHFLTPEEKAHKKARARIAYVTDLVDSGVMEDPETGRDLKAEKLAYDRAEKRRLEAKGDARLADKDATAKTKAQVDAEDDALKAEVDAAEGILSNYEQEWKEGGKLPAAIRESSTYKALYKRAEDARNKAAKVKGERVTGSIADQAKAIGADTTLTPEQRIEKLKALRAPKR